MAAVFHRSTRDLVTVSGPEAVTWLQGQLSQDVAGLGVGDVTWTFVLAPQGKVEGWGRIQRIAEDALRIDVDPGAGEAWVTRLERFKLRTKAEVSLAAAAPMLSVRGDQPAGSLPAGWPGTVGGDLLPPLDVSDPEDHAWLETAVAGLIAEGATEIDDAAQQARRIRAGVPAWGAELDPDTIPATIGQWAIDASVSFTKGCYTGQELVARVDSRGGNVPRRLVAVRAAGDRRDVLTAGAEVSVDGEVRARVTSVSVDGDDTIALAFLQRAIDVPAAGTSAGVAVELLALPLR